jgi:signal transduction histidine kinase
MKAICQALLERHAARAERQRVTIDLSLCPEPAFVIGYEGRLKKALDDLMGRALRAMPRGGRLVIRVERGRYVTVEYVDSGRPGSADDLSDVAATITGHGGLLWISEHPGGGTRFTVELRAAGSVRPSAA